MSALPAEIFGFLVESEDNSNTFRENEKVAPGRSGFGNFLGGKRSFDGSVLSPANDSDSSFLQAKSGGWSTSAEEVLTPSQVIAEWHGQVVSIGEDSFVAELKGTIGAGVAGGAEEAQIPLDEVREDDRALLRAGAFFRLCVNVEIRNGTRRRFTDVVFRRLPAYRREELEAARSRAKELVRGLRLE